MVKNLPQQQARIPTQYKPATQGDVPMAVNKERIFLEGDYTKTLAQVRVLFAQAYESATDPVTRQHSQLRMSQIEDLCRQDLQA